jgi:hypothetical protein
MELSVLNIRCAVPNGDVTVTVTPGGQTVTLRDDGAGIDQAAAEGTYSGQWTPAAEGTFTLTFPGADAVTVQVLPRPTPWPPCRSAIAIHGWPAPLPPRGAGGDRLAVPAAVRRRQLHAALRGRARRLALRRRRVQQRPHALQRAAALPVPLDADRPVLGPDPPAHGRRG